VAELSASIILTHFVLELQPVLILLNRDVTFTQQITKMRRYKVLYICTISYACVCSLLMITMKGISYEKKDLFNQSKTLPTILFGTETCRWLLETFIETLFIY
jgi:hypothetical protein